MSARTPPTSISEYATAGVGVLRNGRWGARLAALAFGVGLVALPAAGAVEVTTPTEPPPTSAAPTTAAPTTDPPATTAAPTTAAPTTGPPTTRRAAATTTTVAPTTTTPDQLPTLPPRPEGQLPAPTETSVAPPPDRDAARVSPLFPVLSIGGFTVALLVLVVQFLWSSRRGSAPARPS